MAYNELRNMISYREKIKEQQDKKNRLIDTLMIVLTLVIAVNPTNSSSLLNYLIFSFLLLSICVRCLDIMLPLSENKSSTCIISYVILYSVMAFFLPLIIVALFFTSNPLSGWLDNESTKNLLINWLIPIVSAIMFSAFTANMFNYDDRHDVFFKMIILGFPIALVALVLLKKNELSTNTSSWILVITILLMILLFYATILVISALAIFLFRLINHKILPTFRTNEKIKKYVVISSIEKIEHVKKRIHPATLEKIEIIKDDVIFVIMKGVNILKLIAAKTIKRKVELLFLIAFIYYFDIYALLSVAIADQLFNSTTNQSAIFIKNASLVSNSTIYNIENITIYMQK